MADASAKIVFEPEKPPATTPTPSSSTKWWKKPCPGCTAAGRKGSLPSELLKRTERAVVVVCDCGCVYASEIKAR